MDEVRVRFAPSPTGYLHIGGARTALFNWFFARKHKGKLILRIEDTDRDRLKEDSVSQILTSLKWLGIDWDEGPECGGAYGPYYQFERLEIYKREAQRLIAEDKAYYCFCSAEDLTKMREEQKEKGLVMGYNGKCREVSKEEALRRIASGEKPVIRLKVSAEGSITVKDLIHGEVTFRLDQLDDLIIMKSNGIPAYNFACVVDDHKMAISHVIRAEEHLSNTPKQVLLYQALGYEPVKFAHISMILAPDHTKLSKRHGATSVEEFREQGFLGQAIVNYLTFLGWSTGDVEEIVTTASSIEKFDFAQVSKKAAIYDTKKLAWINGQYMNSLPVETIYEAAMPFILAKKLVSPENLESRKEEIKKIISAIRPRVKTLVELVEGMEYFFFEVAAYDEKGRQKHMTDEQALVLLKKGRDVLQKLEVFDVQHTEEAYRQLIDSLQIKGGLLMHPTRLALTGRMVSPGLFDVMELLGKERCLERMDKAIYFMETEKI